MNNNVQEKKVRIAAVGDIHVRENMKGHYHKLFTEISENADVLVLCGDLTDLGLRTEAEYLANDLRACRIPVVAVLGNHDHQSGQPEEVKRILRQNEHVTLLDQEPIEHFGIGFAGVKGFIGGFDQHALAAFGEQAIKDIIHERDNEAYALENQLSVLKTEKKVVLMHYAPIRETVADEPADIMPFLGSTRFAQIIDQFGASVAFHGHGNLGRETGKTAGGVPVFNVAYPLLQNLTPKKEYLLYEL